MAQISRRIIRISPLGGMDLRWQPQSNCATLIQDMTYDQRGGWVDSGGFMAIVEQSNGNGGSSGSTPTDSNPNLPANTGNQVGDGGN